MDEKKLLNSIEENLKKIGDFDREELDKPTKWNRLMDLRNKVPANASTASVFFPNQPWRLDKPWFNRTKMSETEIDETISKLEKNNNYGTGAINSYREFTFLKSI